MSAADLELLRAWQAGDRQAGSELIGRYVEPLQRFFVNKVRAPEDVEDLVQRTFTALVTSLAGFRGEASFRTWVYAIARNILREWARERAKLERVDFQTMSMAELGIGLSTELDARRDHSILLEALRRLALDQQILLELQYLQRLTYTEIAAVLDVPLGTTKHRLKAAKRALARLVEELAEGPTPIVGGGPPMIGGGARGGRGRQDEDGERAAQDGDGEHAALDAWADTLWEALRRG